MAAPSNGVLRCKQAAAAAAAPPSLQGEQRRPPSSFHPSATTTTTSAGNGCFGLTHSLCHTYNRGSRQRTILQEELRRKSSHVSHALRPGETSRQKFRRQNFLRQVPAAVRVQCGGIFCDKVSRDEFSCAFPTQFPDMIRPRFASSNWNGAFGVLTR